MSRNQAAFPDDDPRHGTNTGRAAHQRAKTPICDPCRLAYNEYARARVAKAALAGLVDENDTVLNGDGRWVTDKGGIRRWEADLVARPDKYADEPPIAEVRRLPVDTCPDCSATGDELCRKPNGRARRRHASRIGQRMCPCGTPARLKWCDTCAEDAKRANWRNSQRRRRGTAASDDEREDGAA